MQRLRVVPTSRHGRNRLYVCLPDGRNIAWYDREAGRVSLLGQGSRREVLDALGPYLTGPVTVGPPPVPTPAELARLSLHPDDDLAPNRPGEAVLVDLERDPGRTRRPVPWPGSEPRRAALAAEQTVGEALDRLDGAGWRVLHSIPLPGGTRIHHLVIGPGGLRVVHALPAHKRGVVVADPMVTVGRARPRPLLRSLRAQADRASYALTAEVRPLLALAGPVTRLLVTVAPAETWILRDEELPALARVGGALKPADVEALYAVARDRHTWERV